MSFFFFGGEDSLLDSLDVWERDRQDFWYHRLYWGDGSKSYLISLYMM